MTMINILCVLDIILIILGIVFLLVTFFINKMFKQKKEICKYRVIARIIDIEERKMKNYVRQETVTRISAFNCYEYEHNMEKIRVWSNIGNMPGKFQIGQQVILYCNPNKPTEFYCEEESVKTVATVFRNVGTAILSVAIIFIAVTFSIK